MAFTEGSGEQPKRRLFDIHLTTFYPNALRFLIRIPNHQPLDLFGQDEILAVCEMVRKGNEETLRQLVLPIGYGSNDRPQVLPHEREEGLPHIVERLINRAGTSDMGNAVLGVYHDLSKLRKYSPHRRARNALRESWEKGIKNTMVTAIPECCAPAVELFLNYHGFTPYLDPELSIIQRRLAIPKGIYPRDRMTPTASSIISGGLCMVMDGQPPQASNDSKVVIEWMEQLYGSRTYNPLDQRSSDRWRKVTFSHHTPAVQLQNC